MSAPSAILSLLQGSKSAPPNPTESVLGDASKGDPDYFVSLVKQNIEDIDAKRLKSRENNDSKSDAIADGNVKVAINDDDLDELNESRPVAELAAFGNTLPLPSPLPPASISFGVSLPAIPSPAMVVPGIEVAVTAATADTQLEDFAVGMGIDRRLAKLLLQQTAFDTTLPSTPVVGASVSAGVMSSVASAATGPIGVSLVGTSGPAALGTPAAITPVGMTLAVPNMGPSLAVVAAPAAAASLALDESHIHREPSSSEQTFELVETLSDEDVLRWRAVTHRSDWLSPTRDISTDLAGTLEIELSKTLSDSDFAAASAALRGMTLDRLTGAANPDTAGSMASVSGFSTPAIGPIASIGGAATGNVGQLPMPSSADTATPVRVPDGSLPIEQRAEEFAEQVGRRLLQQIRESRWTVSLQLDPQHLGPMDIELQLEGNQVVANVAVASPEVRHLLESALPKLRESLDSAGLNLAGWSFAQSGSHGSRDFAEQFAAVGGTTARVAEEAASTSSADADLRDEQSTRAVDVYV